MRILLRLKLFLVDSGQVPSGDAHLLESNCRRFVKPRGKTGLTAKTTDVFIHTQECLLRKIVCESDVRSSKLAEQTAHGGLMPPNELTESRSGHHQQELARPGLHQSAPQPQITVQAADCPSSYRASIQANSQHRSGTESGPGSRSPLPNRSRRRECHQTYTDHSEINPAQTERWALGRWWIQQCIGHGLPFFQPSSALFDEERAVWRN